MTLLLVSNCLTDAAREHGNMIKGRYITPIQGKVDIILLFISVSQRQQRQKKKKKHRYFIPYQRHSQHHPRQSQ